MSAAAPRARRTIPGMRWWIVALIFGAAVLNYVDRQVLSALAPTIQKDLGMDDRDYANVVNIFLVAYTIAYLVSGRITDRLGTRAGMILFVVWWSVSNMATGLAQGLRSLGVFRFFLGLGEAGVWPAASKAVSEWFPPRERALAIGVYTMGATIGATLAPYLVIPLARHDYAQSLPWAAEWLGTGTGWRMAFILTGLLGLVWLVPWLIFFRQPRQSPYVSDAERALIESGDAQRPAEVGAPWTWGQVFTSRIVWLLLLGRLVTDPIWYFYQFWFPKYLNTDRHLTQDQLTITWIVYAAAGVGSLAGGWLSGQRVKRGTAPAKSRLQVMAGCAVLSLVAPMIASVASTPVALALTVVAVMAALAWLINISSLVVDVVPKHSLGTVFSVVATGSTIGGILMNTLVAFMVAGPSTRPAGFLDQALQSTLGPLLALVQGRGYGLWFILMAALQPIGWLILWGGGIHRLATKASSPARA